MKTIVAFVLFVVACAFALSPIFFLTSCSSPEAKRAEAASSYAGKQADCIARFETRSEIDACRDRVKAAWSNDAGTEAGK